MIRIRCLLPALIALPALLCTSAAHASRVPGVFHGDARIGPKTQGANPPVPQTSPQGQVLFVNFDDITFTLDQTQDEDSSMNRLWDPQLARAWMGYQGAEAEKATIVQAVVNDYAPFNIEVVTARPTDGAYVMSTVVGERPFGPVALGIAQLDCFDVVKRNIGFGFYPPGHTESIGLVATTVAHEAAHTMGLQHIDSEADTMYWSIGDEDPTFLDECVPVDGQHHCAQQHAEHCPTGQQNSFRTLLSLLGPADGAGEDAGDESGDGQGTDDAGTDGGLTSGGTLGETDTLPPLADSGGGDGGGGGCRASGAPAVWACGLLGVVLFRRRRD